MSTLFTGDVRLQEAATSHPRHILLGDRGPHVGKIQRALQELDGAKLDRDELAQNFYGPSTAVAVKAYKTKRSIVNGAYQASADDIVGIMTVVALDREWRDVKDGRVELHEVLGPPLLEPMPGDDAIAPDGFFVPIPKSVRTQQGRVVRLERAHVNLFKEGDHYVMVVDNLQEVPTHPNAKEAAKAAASASAKRAVNVALRRSPDFQRRALAFGAGKIAGGVVSVAASVLEPSPLANELHWSAVVNGQRVKYVVLTTDQ